MRGVVWGLRGLSALWHLDAALDGGPQKIEGEDGVGDNSEQGEGIVELDDDGVEEGAQATAAVKKQLEDDLQDPGYGDDDAPDAEEELGPGDDGVAARLLVANFQAFVFGFELVTGGGEVGGVRHGGGAGWGTEGGGGAYTRALNWFANALSFLLFECVAKPCCFSLPICSSFEVFSLSSFFFFANSATSLKGRVTRHAVSIEQRIQDAGHTTAAGE